MRKTLTLLIPFACNLTIFNQSKNTKYSQFYIVSYNLEHNSCSHYVPWIVNEKIEALNISQKIEEIHVYADCFSNYNRRDSDCVVESEI